MPPADWIEVRRGELGELADAMSPAALEQAVRLFDTVLRDDRNGSPVAAVAETLAAALEADRIDCLNAAGWRTDWSWPAAPRGAKPDWPTAVLSQSLDRGAATAVSSSGGRSSMLIAPISSASYSNRLLVASRSRSAFERQDLELLASLVPVLATVIEHGRQDGQARHRVRRLESLVQVTRELSFARDTSSLLERLATESTRLLDADRASIFVWDRANRNLVGRPALGVSGGDLRLPEDFGIVGHVLKTGEPAIVNDVRQDPRFGAAVDTKSGYQTRSLLCVPMRDPDEQRIGVFEVINKNHGEFTDEDRETLELLAAHAAVALENTIERDNLVRTNAQLTSEVSTKAQIIGVTPVIEALRSTVARIAATELPVLILGESGTGKEVVARAIHYGGPRRNRPFIPVNCAAIAETLLESELFGHEKGAFTDARETRQGKFELASGGTLLLDEIGDMSAAGQAKLLRVLEEKIVYRVGGSQPIHADVRIIAATNRQLAGAVQSGKFRQDLFFRLSVVTIQLPPLRERRDDIEPLATHFLEQFCRDARRPTLKLSAEARKRLVAHEWPGNVRELRNLMERIAFLAPGPTVEPADLAFTIMAAADSSDSGVPPGLSLGDATDQFQRSYITTALDRSRNNQAEAARLLGLHRSNLYRKMRQLGMETP
jgi:Nif-specific regulatory protein